MSIDTIEIHVLIGLPACGKSTYAKKLKNSLCRADIVSENDCQSHNFLYGNQKTRFEPLQEESMIDYIKRSLEYYPSTIILDGLFLKTDQILNIFRFISERRTIKKAVLDYWPEDKDACLRNDYRRRSIGSALSIQSLSIDVDFDAIKAAFPMTVVKKHDTPRIPDYELFFRNCSVYNEGRYLNSASWSLGGLAWDYTGSKRLIDPEEQPARFDSLDLLIREMFPAMTHIDSQIIYEHCVTVETKENSDYYSRISQAYFQCDLELLYEMAVEMGYLDQSLFSDEEHELLTSILQKEVSEMSMEEKLIKKLYLSSGRQIEIGEEEMK